MTKKMIFYQFLLFNYYHLVLMVGGWLLYKLEIFQNMGKFYTICVGTGNLTHIFYMRAQKMR